MASISIRPRSYRPAKTWEKVVVSVGVVVGVITMSMAGINKCMITSKNKKAVEVIEQQRDRFSETFAEKSGIKLAEAHSIQVGLDEKGYLLQVFGSVKENFKDNEKYANVSFEIKDEDANNIINAIQKFESTKRGVKTPGSEADLAVSPKITDGLTLDMKVPYELSAATKSCCQVYEAMNEALKRATLKEIDEIGDKTSLESAIRRAFVEKLTVSRISGVVRDEEKDVNYFLIEGIQTSERTSSEVVEKFKGMVEVKDASLSDAEVYAKFILGDYSAFNTISLEDEDISIFQGENRNDIQEAEMVK